MLNTGNNNKWEKAGRSACRNIVACILSLSMAPAFGQSVELPVGDLPVNPALAQANQSLEPLFLEVMINDQPTNLIASFFRSREGKIGAAVAELNEIGVKTAPKHQPDDIVFLSDIPSLQYVYDQSAQLLMINLVDEHRVAKEYNSSPSDEALAITTFGCGSGGELFLVCHIFCAGWRAV